MKALALAGALMLASLAAHADSSGNAPDDREGTAWKLTLGHYQYPHLEGQDVNLRWQIGNSHTWLGHYHDADFGSQTRVGWDSAYDLNDWLSLQPSVQAATRGFLGGSINLQAGHEWFGLIGLGRTNLKPYFNLNFDPNDAITLGAGHAFDNGQTWTFFVVSDNRTHTQQTDWHLLARIPIGTERLTFDLMEKSGQSDVGFIRAWGTSVTWDYPRWFVRMARDPKQNFSASDAWRLSLGFRY